MAASAPIVSTFFDRTLTEATDSQGDARRQLEDALKSTLLCIRDFLKSEEVSEESPPDLWPGPADSIGYGERSTVQSRRQRNRALRAAIFEQIPEGVGLSARAAERISQLFEAAMASAAPGSGQDAAADQQLPSRKTATERRHEAIEIERANFSNLFRQSPEMVCILSGPEHRFEFVNEAHVRALGFDATGQTVRHAQPESVEIHDILDNVYRTGKTAELREMPVTVTDRLRYFNLTYAARRNGEGEIDGIMVLGTEITDQVLFRESQSLQQKALELALENAPLDQVLEVMAKMVEGQSGTDLLASILLIDDSGRYLLHGAAPSLPAAYNEAIHGIEIGPQAGSCGGAAHELSGVIVEDIEHDPRWERHKGFALGHGLKACWSVPILTAHGKLLGTFALYARTVRGPTPREEQIVNIAVRTTALIIGRRREISERLANAEALRESESELKFTLASARLGTWKIDFKKGGLVTLSAETAAMFGFEIEYADPQKATLDCVHPDDREHVSQVWSATIASGRPYHDVYRICCPNGEVRWIDSRGRTRYGADGSLEMLSGVVMDITEQKLAAENLAASKRMLELAASGARIGFWHLNTTRDSFEPDEKMAADWGIDLATFPRTFAALMEIVHPEDRWIITTGMANALAGTEVYDKEFRVILPSGEERWIQAKGEFFADESGQRTLFSGVSIDITDKKLGALDKQRLADAIAREREKLEQVLDQTTVPTALLEGPNHVFSFANSAYLRTFELDESIKGKSVAEVFPDALAQGFGKLLDEVFETGKPFEGRESLFERKTRSGGVQTHFVDFTYAAKRNQENRIEGVLATIVDVTDRVLLRRETEKANALLQAERFSLNEIFRYSPAAMATWVGPNFVFDRVNPAYLKIFGERPLVGRELLEACPELRGQGFDDLLRNVLETGEPYIGTQVLAKIALTPGGPTEDRYFDFRYVRISDQDGKPYGVYDFAIDVTAQVIAQRQLEASTAKLREAEGLLKRAIAVANIGFYEWDITSNRITFSAQMQKDWGIEAGSSIEAAISHIHPDDRERVNRSIAKTLAERTKYFEEYRVLRPTDGKTVWIEAQGGLAEDSFGKLTRFVGTSLDITQRKHTEEQLKAASLEAHNASTAKSAFLANMSHEIRSPLGAIMGFAELLKKPDLSRQSSINFIAIIERNSQHLLRIVDDILDLSKVEAGKMVFEHIEFSLPDLLSDFSSLMGLRARDKGIDFSLRIATPIPELIISDPTRLRQILNNVVGNAIKFTERGFVELSVRYEDKRLEIQVKDTGRGISSEQAERLFQAFVQADESTTRKYGGTGLGLVLTKRLASAMGGDFYLKESKPDHGSIFVAFIRIGLISGTRFVGDQSLAFSTAEEIREAPQRSILAGMRLLVVDDSSDNRTLLTVMLQDAGALVQSAQDGQQGVELALAAQHDAVLMDIQMPRMDGYQAIEILKARGYATPIIALTAHAMVEERERAKGKGFAAFMSKPIQRDSLLNLLAGLLRKHGVATPPGTRAVSAEASAQQSLAGILIVEDNDDQREILVEFLSDLGIPIKSARSGTQALEILDEGFRPTLVLLDLTLPDMPGGDVLQAVRNAPGGKDTRIIIVSGWDNLPSRAAEIGADGSLRKPINLQELSDLARALKPAG